MEIYKVTLSTIASLAVLLNIHALYFLCRKKSKNNYLILCINLSISDLIQSALGFIIQIFYMTVLKTTSNLCKLSAFFVFFPGLTSISLLTSITLTRLLWLTAPFLTKRHGHTVLFKIIGPFAWIYALFWSVLPLIGVSSYTLDSSRSRCSIKWVTNTSTEKSYIISLLVFCYITPVVIITTSSIFMENLIHRQLNQSSRALGLKKTGQKLYRSREYKAKLSIRLLSFSFIVCWTPYAVIGVLSAFTSVELPNYIHDTGALLAKLSSVFNPIIIYWRRDLLKNLNTRYSKSKTFSFLKRM